MLDITLFREEKTRNAIKESEKKRFKNPKVVDEIWELDERWRKVNYLNEQENKEINKIQKEIKNLYLAAKKTKTDQTSEIAGFEDKKTERVERQLELKDEAEALKKEIQRLLHTIGNIVDDRVPVAKNDDGNIDVRSFASVRTPKKDRGYAEIMAGYTNAKAGAVVIGHRGYYLDGEMALLARALKNYAIDFIVKRKYKYIQTPVMMRRDVVELTAQLSDFDDQLYKVEDDLYLIATSEQPLTALFKDTVLTQYDLPQKLGGDSLCFRKEAGAYGKDNAGIFRVHQFDKIEQLCVCRPEESPELHEEMLRISEEFYQTLDISYKVVLIASGELNDAAAMKYDIEALFPNAEKYRELVSASNCTDYQSRNLNVCFEYPVKDEKPVYVHMLNSTLCAIQRTLCCIVENYQDDGRVIVPDVLRPYTGFDFIEIE